MAATDWLKWEFECGGCSVRSMCMLPHTWDTWQKHARGICMYKLCIQAMYSTAHCSLSSGLSNPLNQSSEVLKHRSEIPVKDFCKALWQLFNVRTQRNLKTENWQLWEGTRADCSLSTLSSSQKKPFASPLDAQSLMQHDLLIFLLLALRATSQCLVIWLLWETMSQSSLVCVLFICLLRSDTHAGLFISPQQGCACADHLTCWCLFSFFF